MAYNSKNSNSEERLFNDEINFQNFGILISFEIKGIKFWIGEKKKNEKCELWMLISNNILSKKKKLYEEFT